MAADPRVAVVTAAAGAGIGAAVARRLARDGFDVVVTDAHERRCREFADALADEVGREVSAHHLDVTDHDQVRAVMSEVAAARGGLDVLVNNAGWSRIEPVAEMSLDTWQRCLDVDLTGTFVCMRYALEAMIAGGGGSIINISSIAAWEMSTEHGAAYSAAKAGVLALTRVAAAENAAHGVRVNAVAPGLIYNDFLRRIYPQECQVPVPVLQVGSGSCVTHPRRFQAALIRDGRPPAFANAPCSRLRSWRIGCTLSTSPPAEISTVPSTMATWTWRPRCALPAR